MGILGSDWDEDRIRTKVLEIWEMVVWFFFTLFTESISKSFKEKIYKDRSEDMSIVNNNFDNLPDTSQVIKGMKVFQSGRIKKLRKKC